HVVETKSNNKAHDANYYTKRNGLVERNHSLSKICEPPGRNALNHPHKQQKARNASTKSNVEKSVMRTSLEDWQVPVLNFLVRRLSINQPEIILPITYAKYWVIKYLSSSKGPNVQSMF